MVQLLAKVRGIFSWLVIRDLTGPLISLIGVIVTTAVALVGWRVAGQFQQLQRDLDAKSKLSVEIENLGDLQKRRFAFPALVQYADQNPAMVVDSIMTLLDDKDQDLRETCYRALERINQKRSIVKLVEGELVNDHRHPTGIPLALSRLQGKKAFDVLEQSFSADERPESKAACAVSLGQTRDERALTTLLDCVKQKREDLLVRSGCIDGLGKLEGTLNDQESRQAAGVISDYLYDSKLGPPARLVIVEFRNLETILDGDHKRTVAGALATALKDNAQDSALMTKFVTTICKVGGKDDLQDLVSVLVDNELQEEVRITAMNAVVKLGGPNVIPRLRKILKGHLRSPRIKIQLDYWEKHRTETQACENP